MELSTARRFALLRTTILVAMAIFAGGVGALMIVGVVSLLLDEPLTTRGILYFIQRRFLWPSGIHLDDGSWNTAYAMIDRILTLLTVIVFLTGAGVVVVSWRKAFKRFYWRALDEMRPADYPACSVCWYDLTGNESGVCPECGTPVRRDPNQIFAFPTDTNS